MKEAVRCFKKAPLSTEAEMTWGEELCGDR